MATGPSLLALRLQACLRMVLCWGPGPPGPALRLLEPLARALAWAGAGPGSCATKGSACGGNAASQRGVLLAARALPRLGCLALLWPVVLVVVEALLPLVPVPLVEVLVMPVEVLVPPVV